MTHRTQFISARWRRARAASLRSRQARAINRALIGATPALRQELLEISMRD